MKKYLILSVVSVALCLVLIVRLYKTRDIPWVDLLVEGTSEVIGFQPKMVKEKIQRRQSTQAAMELKAPVDTVSVTVAPVDSMQLVVENADTAATKAIVPRESKARRLFHVVRDSVVVQPDTPRLSPPKVEAIAPPQRKKLFNSEIDKAQEATKPLEKQVTFFMAKVNGAQRFANDQQISFRTTKALTLGDLRMPENFVFQARASVLNNRIHFILEAINQVPVSGENFTDATRGIPLTNEFRLGQGYYMPEGYPTTFGIKP